MKSNGFTLIELLIVVAIIGILAAITARIPIIVVAIIGILAAIAVPNFLNAQLRAKIAGTQTDLRNLVAAMQQYHLDNNSYQMHRGGFAQQFPLTTPVAYLNGFLYDRFQIRPDIAQQAGFETTRTFYHWIPWESHTNLWSDDPVNGHPEVVAAQNTKNGGLVDGWGPAGIRGGPPYDSTNGLTSLGGFMKLVPAGQQVHGYTGGGGI